MRKGVLIIGQLPDPDHSHTKMELWRYRFPPQFAPLLPPLFPSANRLPADGDANLDVLRAKVVEIGKLTPSSPQKQDG